MPRKPAPPKFISTKEAAAILGVSTARVRQLCLDGKLVPAGRYGPRDDRLFDRASVVAFGRIVRKRGRPKDTQA